MINKNEFSQIYDKYVGDIFRYVFLKVNSKALAEDITSDVFLKTWQFVLKDKEEYKEIEKVRPFLYKIACNSVVDYYRRKDKSEVVLVDSLSEGETKEDLLDKVNVKNNNLQDMSEEYLKNEDVRRVKEAVDKLDEKYKDIVLLYFLEGFSHKEIAEITGKSSVNVRVGLYRSLKKLREFLEV